MPRLRLIPLLALSSAAALLPVDLSAQDVSMYRAQADSLIRAALADSGDWNRPGDD
jgi:hypothetical protein